MPWETRRLNDGTVIPGIAFGTRRLGNGEDVVENVKTAVNLGIVHVDTSLGYGNEVEAGEAIRQYPRDQVFVTTKWSGQGNAGVEEGIHDSLKSLGLSYVDLYLFDHPEGGNLDVCEAWATMERLKAAGLARSIGVSNFSHGQLSQLLEHARTPPAVNQIAMNPYVREKQIDTLKYCVKHNIVVEGYSPLAPLIDSGGQVRFVIDLIAERRGVTPEMVLLAWAKAKGVVVVTSSSKRWRLADYIKAGELALDADDTRIIDELGAGGSSVAAYEKKALAGGDATRSPTYVKAEGVVSALELAELGGVKALRTGDTPVLPRPYASAFILLAVLCLSLGGLTWGFPSCH